MKTCRIPYENPSVRDSANSVISPENAFKTAKNKTKQNKTKNKTKQNKTKKKKKNSIGLIRTFVAVLSLLLLIQGPGQGQCNYANNIQSRSL